MGDETSAGNKPEIDNDPSKFDYKSNLAPLISGKHLKYIQVYSVKLPFPAPSASDSATGEELSADWIDADLKYASSFKKKSVQIVYSDELGSTVTQNMTAVYDIYRAFFQAVVKGELTNENNGQLTESITAASFPINGTKDCTIRSFDIPATTEQLDAWAVVGSSDTDINLLCMFGGRAVLFGVDKLDYCASVNQAINKIANQSRFAFAPVTMETLQVV